MLDAPDLDYADDLAAAVRSWRPDPQCLAAGDEAVLLAVRRFAAAGLCDQQINNRLLDLAGVSTEMDTRGIGRCDAAIAVARHAAFYGLSLPNIIALLAWLSAELTDGPDADEIATIAQAAFAEFAA